MTLEQLRIFIEVAEREHLTRAWKPLHLTPSAAQGSAIRTMEDRYGATLFNRIGRRIELTGDGRMFLDEARATLQAPALPSGCYRNSVAANGAFSPFMPARPSPAIGCRPFWHGFTPLHPLIDVRLTLGNTESVTQATQEGVADIGLVEGAVQAPSLSISKVAATSLFWWRAPIMTGVRAASSPGIGFSRENGFCVNRIWNAQRFRGCDARFRL